MYQEDLSDADLQKIPVSRNEIIFHAYNHYVNVLDVPVEKLLEGLSVSSENLNPFTSKGWIFGSDFKKLNSNVFRNYNAYINFRLFKHVGFRFTKFEKNIFTTLFSLLTFKSIIKHAEKITGLFDNTTYPELIPYSRNKYYIKFNYYPYTKNVTLGHECRIFEGMLTGFLKQINIDTVSANHLICEKKLERIVKGIYGKYGFEYRDDGKFIYINSQKVAKHVELKLFKFKNSEIFLDRTEESVNKPNAVEVIDDFYYEGHHFFKKGEIFNAPYCVIDIEFSNLNYLKRLFNEFKSRINYKKILTSEIKNEIEISNKHLYEMHRLSEELRDERYSFERKVQERTLELIDANEKLIEFNKSRTEFIANVTHELRTPLTLIKSQIEAIRSGCFGETLNRSSEILDSIDRNSNSLFELISNFLDISKIESKKLELIIVNTDVHDFLESIISNLEPVVTAKDLTCELISDSFGMTVNIDMRFFEKAIYNLLSNAVKFTPAGGKILVSFYESEYEKIITVEDTGTGIPFESQDFIFERFYQADSSLTKVHSGTGIGLALTKEIIELHNGTISVSSIPEEGTVFTVRLPKQKELSLNTKVVVKKISGSTDESDIRVANTHSGLSNFHEPGQKKYNVLIVEDNKDMCDFLYRLMNKEYNILFAYNGREGVKVVDENPVDIVIADIMMPEMDGIEFLTRFRSVKKYSWVPVLMLTARSDFSSKIKSFSLGANDYLVKPFHPEELLARIASLAKLVELYRNYTSSLLGEKKVTENTRFAIDKTLEYLENNYGQNVTREGLAAAVEMSPDHFGRMFKKHTGKKISDYVNELRIKKAIEIINRNNKKRIIDIAFEVGYDNLRSFNKGFLKFTGKAPSEFKK
ncbi:MAG: response regulator [Spirochaetes bacterium]|nr:response regulator [Spirochaetota bacterium]